MFTDGTKPLHALYVLKQQQLLALLRWGVEGASNEKLTPAQTKDNVQLLCGIIFGLKALVKKLRPSGYEEDSKLVFKGYCTDFYKVHCYESPTGLKCVMFTAPTVEEQTPLLETIYKTIIVSSVLRGYGVFTNEHGKLVHDCIKTNAPHLLQHSQGELQVLF